MRPSGLLALLLCGFAVFVAAWTKEDHEIFRLNDELKQHEGENATFYSFLQVKPSASHDDIQKAYRKRSKQLHPDKARQQFINSFGASGDSTKNAKKNRKAGVTVRKKPSQKQIDKFTKEASERYARFSVIAKMLQGPERERYDHFLRNGFPKWRGTGYYYARFRPGFLSVILGLFVFCGGAIHYGVLYLSWTRQREFVNRYIRHARKMAWGDESGIRGIPGLETPGTSTPPQAFEQQQDSDEPQAQTWNRRMKRMKAKDDKKEAKKPKPKRFEKKDISEPIDAELTDGGPKGAKKRVIAQNGKVLIVDSIGNVFLEEETEDGESHEYLLDADEIPQPTIRDTALFRLPLYLYGKTVGRFTGKPVEAIEDEDFEIIPNGAVGEEAALASAVAANPNAESKKRKAKERFN